MPSVFIFIAFQIARVGGSELYSIPRPDGVLARDSHKNIYRSEELIQFYTYTAIP
jgi:hypothetical protein